MWYLQCFFFSHSAKENVLTVDELTVRSGKEITQNGYLFSSIYALANRLTIFAY